MFQNIAVFLAREILFYKLKENVGSLYGFTFLQEGKCYEFFIIVWSKSHITYRKCINLKFFLKIFILWGFSRYTYCFLMTVDSYLSLHLLSFEPIATKFWFISHECTSCASASFLIWISNFEVFFQVLQKKIFWKRWKSGLKIWNLKKINLKDPVRRTFKRNKFKKNQSRISVDKKRSGKISNLKKND